MRSGQPRTPPGSAAAWARRIGARYWEHRARWTDCLLALWYLPFVATALSARDTGLGLLLLGDVLQVLPATGRSVVGGLIGVGVPAVIAVLILLRRSRPQWLLGAAVILLVFGNLFPITVALFTYAAWREDRRRLAAWTAAALGAVAVDAWFSGAIAAPLPLLMTVIVFVATPLVAGLWVGTRRRLIANLHERAERLERERHLLSERAISAERTRIAREMHDVVAHRVSLMVLHVGGLEVSAADERTARTAELIRITGREALAELREILGVLRDDPGEDAATGPQPVLADLARLIGQARAAGMAVDWSTEGSPRPLPAQVERTAYRVVQEALTNAARHAAGCAVQVRVDYGASDIDVTVGNEPPHPPESTGPGRLADTGGYGLVGLRERVGLAGGVLAVGPDPDGGWRVRAVLPVAGAAPPVQSAGGGADMAEEKRPSPTANGPRAGGDGR